MIVSWNWLGQYVDLNMSHDELVDRLTMSGLNYEGTEQVAGDQAIDLEVTSNRADCLGHIGVAREVATLYGSELKIPAALPSSNSEAINAHCSVAIECPDACFRYTARLIKGVKIGPSPAWMQERLQALGIGVVNNVVDATNYVMFECGQPLHAFDFAKIKDGKIVVRYANEKETLEAIDHKTYQLEDRMCVIADSAVPVALGGVMGGADSEVSDSTTDVLIEAAYFDQLSVRNTARKLNLHSPSSFRFERDINSENLDWASRRCCELILESAGGELLDGVVDVGAAPVKPDSVTLRYAQLKRILGIEIPTQFAVETLEALGATVDSSDQESVTVVPPNWRKDLTREVDLIEEVGRIYGFDKVPDDALVPMAASHRPTADRVLDKVRSVMTSAGFDEAVTPSLVPKPWAEAYSPWSDIEPLKSSQPMLGVLEKASQNIGAVDLLRRSLVPSLLEVRRINEFRSNEDIDLFETAKVYLTQTDDRIPDQPIKLALVSGRDYFAIKGIIESLVEFVAPQSTATVHSVEHPLFDIDQACELRIGDEVFGWLGSVSKEAKSQFRLKSDATVCELDLALLEKHAALIVQHKNQSAYPAVSRDFNFVVENSVHWADLESTVRESGGPLLESIVYRETFRDEKKDGASKKRLLLTIVLRSDEATLTGEQAESVCQSIIAGCKKDHSAALLG
jgi:phenylalanyl-tRNA synthetase beta chain